MSENEIVEARRAYYRNWKAANKDKVRESNRKYWIKYAARIKAEKAQAESEDSHVGEY